MVNASTNRKEREINATRFKPVESKRAGKVDNLNRCLRFSEMKRTDCFLIGISGKFVLFVSSVLNSCFFFIFQIVEEDGTLLEIGIFG